MSFERYRAILRQQQKRLSAIAGKEGVAPLRRLYGAALAKIAASMPSGGEMTLAKQRAMEQAVKDVMRQFVGDGVAILNSATSKVVKTIAGQAYQTLAALEMDRTGKPLAISDRGRDAILSAGPKVGFLLSAHQASMSRYGAHVVGKMTLEIGTSRALGRSHTELVDRLMTTGDLEFYQAERIARTELSFAGNETARDTIVAESEILGDVYSQWIEHADEAGRPMDDTVCVDSLAMHGQVAHSGETFEMPASAPFPDSRGKTAVPIALVGMTWAHPPNRPNDRSVINPWRPHWGTPGWRLEGGQRVDKRRALAEEKHAVPTEDKAAARRVQDRVASAPAKTQGGLTGRLDPGQAKPAATGSDPVSAPVVVPRAAAPATAARMAGAALPSSRLTSAPAAGLSQRDAIASAFGALIAADNALDPKKQTLSVKSKTTSAKAAKVKAPAKPKSRGTKAKAPASPPPPTVAAGDAGPSLLHPRQEAELAEMAKKNPAKAETVRKMLEDKYKADPAAKKRAWDNYDQESDLMPASPPVEKPAPAPWVPNRDDPEIATQTASLAPKRAEQWEIDRQKWHADREAKLAAMRRRETPHGKAVEHVADGNLAEARLIFTDDLSREGFRMKPGAGSAKITVEASAGRLASTDTTTHEIFLTSKAEKDLRDFAEAKRTGRTPTKTEVQGMATLVHEMIHSGTPMDKYSMFGGALLIEEITTEVSARWYMRTRFDHTGIDYGYQGDIISMHRLTAQTYGVSLVLAAQMVEAASLAFRRWDKGEIVGSKNAVAAFLEGMPEHGREKMSEKLLTIGDRILAKQADEIGKKMSRP